MPQERRRRLLTLVSLGLLYTVWGSTYLAQRVAVSSFPPLQMVGLRFLIAGGLLFAALRARGAPAPTALQWRGAALSALPLLVTGMGAAAVGIKRVPSGMAALVFGSVPLWTSLFYRLWGGRLRRTEILGLVAGVVCYFFCTVVKNIFKYDDALDVFGIHAVGGIVGAIGTGIVVAPYLGGTGIFDYTINKVADYDMATQVLAQIKGVLVTIVWSGIGSAILFYIVKFTIGLRPTPDQEREGLDITDHGERAYN